MADSRSHPAFIEALLKPDSYPHPVSHCELIETHISWVILAGEFAYKIKKPLNLGFLDFSTLERRRHFCEEELRLNRRLAPGIYLQVVGIGGSDEAPLLPATDGVFEYAVKMRRFKQSAQLDQMLEQGRLLPRHIDAFARMAADFHRNAAVADSHSGYGEPASVWQPMQENFVQIREQLQYSDDDSALDALEVWSRQQCEALEPLLKRRKTQGFVRECHGDMHLRNLAWIDDEAIAFDCIEFNPGLRWIDVISEVAFMVMDLQARRQPLLAQRFLNRYLEETGDYEALSLLSFYLVYRALVRAKVAAISHKQSPDGAQSRQALAEYRGYLELAEGYTGTPGPLLMMARGVSASGKSTLSGALLERMGAIRLRSDIERKRLFGMRPEDNGHAAHGEGIYTPAASARTYERLAELAQVVLQAGYPVIIDAVCAAPEQRRAFERLAERLGLPWLIAEFTAASDILRQRIVERSGGPSDADLAVLERQLAGWAPVEESERRHTLAVDTGGAVDTEALLGRIEAALEALRQA